jgi:hypothetical protein
MVEVKFNDLNGSKSLRRSADLSSCVSRHLSQMDGVVIYIFMDVPLFIFMDIPSSRPSTQFWA